ncbi:unnamed protein product [Tilletia controversa]|uniref:Rgp1-domain-containing protein n=3 Tax=Tilletia TaxID=13289 RepID=A0A8X7MYU9_9BASI|nr:hypothetical protein CF336_g191 [Tilletia laevis]KAE8203736.1 hypothetical protein CF328_g1486 [Tilletia controversa]KAE8265593.1 hypothetical protein A4X03_0g157 [Tilletia caries]KAE8208887.1 hypothetical protein CF335_g87 [Tilletia laevis]KAE8252994.1 hypothetical protein A4X06_0g1774 [Tilletia controversa]
MAVTVSVRPASSSFFAGEHFVCFITFTNTAHPQHTAHDAAGSTSASADRRRQQPFLHRVSASEDDDQLSEVAPSESDAATETASVAGNGSFVHVQETSSASTSFQFGLAGAADTSISAGTFPGRKPSTPIGHLHPHSRKMSIRNDFHLAFPDDPILSNPSPARPDVAMSSSSSFIAPSTPTRGPLFSPLFPSSAASSSVTSLSASTASSSLNDKISPGRPSLSSNELRGRLAQTPGSAHILWSFAQLSGSFQLDESMIKPAEFNALKQRLADHSSAASSGGVFGGGDLGHDVQLDIEERVGWGSYLKNALTAPVSPSLSTFGLGSPNIAQEWGSPSLGSAARGGPRHSSSASLAVPSGLGSANGLGSSSPIIGPTSPSLSRRRVSHKRTGSTLQDTRERTLMNRNIPTLSTPPSILFVDHVLAPGESKTYSFRLPLPLDLPPTFLGRSIQFTYTLTIGVNRSPDSSVSPALSGPSAPKSKLFNIPIRLYNNVALPHGEPAFWDLGNPVIKGRDEGMVKHEPQGPPSSLSSGHASSLETPPDPQPLTPTKGTLSRTLSSDKAKSDKNTLDLQNYARALLGLPEEEESTQEQNGSETNGKSLTLARPNINLRRMSSSTDTQAAEDVETHTCSSATDILATNSSKVSYDISKDGSIAAVLTLVRSRYRLGDTVQGVVSMNAKEALTRIVRLAVTLESHEDIEPTLSSVAPVSKAIKLTRVIHAEHHESTLDKGRVPFSLSIPSGATPDFKTSAVKLKWTVKLSLLTLASIKDLSSTSLDGNLTPLPGTPLGGPPPLTPGSTAPSTPSTPSAALGESPLALMPALPPPPHLIPSKPDGFALYHSAWRAVKYLAGPGVAASGNPTMLAPLSLEKSQRRRELTAVPSSDEKKERVEEDVTPTNTAPPTNVPTITTTTTEGEESFDEEKDASFALHKLEVELPTPTPQPQAFATETRLEIVECAVPVRILPSTTNFAVGNFVFEA